MFCFWKLNYILQNIQTQTWWNYLKLVYYTNCINRYKNSMQSAAAFSRPQIKLLLFISIHNTTSHHTIVICIIFKILMHTTWQQIILQRTTLFNITLNRNLLETIKLHNNISYKSHTHQNLHILSQTQRKYTKARIRA